MTKSARLPGLILLSLAVPLAASAASQTIAFDAIPNQIFGGSPFPITARASSSLPVTFASTTPGICKTSANLVMLLSPGPCFITASQSGNGTFDPANATRGFTVSQAKPSGTLTTSYSGPTTQILQTDAIAKGDFNGDGIPDLVAAGGNHTAMVLLGNGAGGFTKAGGSPFAIGAGASSVVVGDFNVDGIQDLAIVGGDTNTLEVLLGNGSGGFSAAPGSPFNVGSAPASAVAGDFNGDGIQDLAVGNAGSHDLTVLFGNGFGGFTAASGSPFALGANANPISIGVADFNGDGNQDLAVINVTDVSVLLGNGLGGFTPASGSPFPAGQLSSLVIGDFNGDGYQDIATNQLVLLGNGSGEFTATTPYTTALYDAVVIGDFNGDGIPDLATISDDENANDVTIWLGNGMGGFTQAGVFPVTGNVSMAAVVGDFNGDGIQDIATANYGTNGNVTVLLGGIVPTNSVLSTTSPLTVSFGQPVPLTLTVSDAATAFTAPTGTATFSDGATVLGVSNQSGTPFLFSTASLVPGSHNLTAVYSGDARTSASTSNTLTIQVDQASQTISFGTLGNVAFGSGNVTLTATASSALTVTFASTTAGVCTVAGNVVTLVSAGACSITASQAGNGNYAAAPGLTQSFAVTAAQTITFDAIPTQILGGSPFVIAAEASSGLPVTLNVTTSGICKLAANLVILRSPGTCSITATQPGNGNYSPATLVIRSFTVGPAKASGTFIDVPDSPFPVGTHPDLLAVGDFNGDGVPDLVVGNAFSNSVTVLLGNGSGGFVEAEGSPIAGASAVVGDFNGDGILDLVAHGGSNVTVLLGNGSGGFSVGPSSPFAAPGFMVVGDFNGDGIQDLAAADSGSNNVAVLLGNGSGGFVPATGSPFAVGASPTFVAVADFNGDGVQDIIAGGDHMTVLLGNGSGGFTEAPGSPLSTGAGFIAVGDFNGDGVPDVAVPDSSTSTITVLLGNGAGGFAPASGSPFGGAGFAGAVAVGDFNGDGISDLAVVGGGNAYIPVLLGNGSGGFVTNGSWYFGEYDFSNIPGRMSVVVADFNGDGRLDLATANAAMNFNNVSVLLGALMPTTSVLSTTSQSTIAFGQPVLLTLTVSTAATPFNPTGGIAAFSDGATALGTASQSSSPYTFTTTGLSVGSHTLTATYGGGTGSAASTSNTLTIQVNQASQTISFGALSNAAFGSGNVTLAATASSGLTVTFASTTTGVCTVAGNVVTLVSAGACSITASQPGNTNYLAAATVTRGFMITQAAQTITCAPLSNALLESGAVTVGASASSGLAVTFTSNTTAVCTVSGVTVMLVTLGNCSITAAQAGNTNYLAAASVTRAFTVSLPTPSITSVTPSTTPASGPAAAVTIAGSNFISGATVSFTPPGGAAQTITPDLIQTAELAATIPAAFLTTAGTAQIAVNNGFGTVSNQVPFTITGAQTISFDAIPNQILGISPFPIAARASSALPIGLASTTPAICKNSGSLVSLLSAGTCSITASQPGNAVFAAATPVTRSFTVSPAKPSGSFMAATGSPFAVGTGTQPVSVVAGDFNGDGIPDLATANYATNSVTVLFGDGAGKFTPSPGSPYTVGQYPKCLVAGDFNNDGFEDLAVASEYSNSLTVLLGNGSGGFAATVRTPFSDTGGTSSMVVADFNGDGIQDLVAANENFGTLTVLLGNGSGEFTATAASPFSAGGFAFAVATGDFNADGVPDLAAVGDSGIFVLLGNTSGGFTTVPGGPFPLGAGASSVVVGDFNGDGIQDLATANQGGSVTVLLGDGTGAFIAPPGSPYVAGTHPGFLVVGDFNGDGVQDLAVANLYSNNVSLLLGTGSGGFAVANGSPLGVGTGPASLVTGDFNGDGIEDLVSANQAGNVTVLLGSVVGHTSQTIAFGALNNVNYGTAPFMLTASTSSGLAVSFESITPFVCTVTGSTVTIVGGVTCSIVASQAGNSTYAAAATVTQSFTVNSLPQTIAFGSLNNVTYGVAPFAIFASADSGLTVSLVSSTTGVCTVSGAAVTILNTGTCSITASQAGNSNYLAATPVTQSFSVLANNNYTGQPATCSAPTANALFIRAEGTTEQIADTTISCAGGFSGSLSLTLYLSPSVNITSATVGAVSETTAGVNATSTTLAAGAVHGVVSGNSVTFSGIPFPAGAFTVTITNLRIDASTIAKNGFTPGEISETIFVSGTNVTPSALTTTSAVAYVLNGLTGVTATGVTSNPVCSAVTSAAPNFGVQFAEGFPNAFKVKGSAAANSTLGSWFANHTETGYGVTSGAASNTATYGTRIKVVFNNIPTNVAAYIPLTITNNGGIATLTASETGAFSAVSASTATGTPNGAAALTVIGGSATAIYEVTTASSSPATYTVPVYLVAGAGTVTASSTAITATVSFAPLGVLQNVPGFATNSGTTISGSVFSACGSKTLQTITFGSLNNVPLRTGTVALAATASSGLPVTFSTLGAGLSPNCSASGNGVTLLNPGSCSVTASQPGDSTWAAAAPVTQTFTITSTNAQSISFAPLNNVASGTAPFAIGATATSGLPVSFASTTMNVCTISGSTVTITGTGACSITASQTGNATYLAATPVTRSFSVVVVSGQATCSTVSANAVFARSEGVAEQVADASISCTGGNALPVNITVYLSPTVNITSATLGVGGVSETLAGLNATASTFAPGAVNGAVSGNSVTFTGVPTSSGAFTLTITNIRIDAATLLTLNGAPLSVTEAVFVSGAGAIPAVLGEPAVAYLTNGLTSVAATGVTTNPVCLPITSATPGFNVQFGEGFPNAFKVQGSAAVNSTLGSEFTNHTETGYGVISAGASNMAASGTRVKIVFNEIPANVALYLPVTVMSNGGAVTLTASDAALFSPVAASGATGAPPGAAALTVVGGSATAIYEVTALSSSPATYTLPVYLVAAAGAVPTQSAAIMATVSLDYFVPAVSFPGFTGGLFTIGGTFGDSSPFPVVGSAFVACGSSAASQAILFAPIGNTPASSGTVTLTATATSGLPVTLTSTTPGVCTVAASLATLTGAGTCSITATQPGDANYAAATPVTRTFLAGSTNAQTIAFGPLVNAGLGAAPFTIGATSSSGLAVSFASITTGVCTVSGSTVTILTTGTCSITASQPGNGIYLAATPVTQSFSVIVATSPATCSSATANAVFVRAEGTTEQVADTTLTCTGGNSLPITIVLYLSPSATITSATVGTAGSSVSETLAGLNNTSTTLAGGAVHGVVSGNSVTFTGVPTAVGSFTITITNIKINASQIISGVGVPTGISETLFISGSGVTPAAITTGSAVAYVTSGLSGVSVTNSTSSATCSAITAAAPSFNVHFAEAFPNSFKVQGSAAANSALDSWYTNHTETGYAVTSGGATNTATSGARIKIVFNNIPANVTMYVPVSATNNGGILTLTQSEAGIFSAVPASTVTGAPAASAALTVVAGMATAIYEATAFSSSPATYNIPVYLVAAAGTLAAQPSAISATVSFAPIGAAANVPNFVVGSSTVTVNGSTFVGCAQTITFGAPGNLISGAGTGTLTATASSGLPVGFASTTPGVCTVAANIVTPVGGGACSITASQPGNPYYAAAPNVIQGLTVTPGAQTITFGTLSNVSFSATQITLSATATSGLPVSFISTTAATCTVSGNTVTLVSVGFCLITASQPGNASYATAANIQQGFTVSQAAQTISFDAIPNQIFGISPFQIAAKASSGLPLTLASTTPAICKTASGLVMLFSGGTCSIAASQPGNANYDAATSVTRSFVVTQAKPSGTLMPSTGSPFVVDGGPASTVVGDFNGDGILDLATLNYSGNTISVLFGDGSGGFTPAAGSPIATGANLLFIVAGDFNGDEIEDLAYGIGVSGDTVNLGILLGSRSGTFTAGSGPSFGAGLGLNRAAVGDFNGDGVQDIAVVCADHLKELLVILLGNGSGGFTVTADSPLTVPGANSLSIAVGDFDGNGIQDLALANEVSGEVTVLLGNGSGGFAPVLNNIFGGSTLQSVAVGDFNGDGVQDLAVADEDNVNVFLGDGAGKFTAAAGNPFAVGSEPLSIVVGDFNGDGIHDLATASASGVTVLLGNGSSGFTQSAGVQFAAGANPQSLVVGDFNGDGIEDLAVANNGSNNVTILLGGPAATRSVLSTTSPLTITLGQSAPLSLAVSDTGPAFSAPTGAVTFSDGATVVGTAAQTSSLYTFTATSLGVGTHTLTATYSGDARTSGSTSDTLTIQVNLDPQTITFGPLSSVAFGSGNVTLTATASSALAVTFASTTPAVCTVAGAAVTLVSAGNCSIAATQTGNSTYAAATSVVQTFTITQAAQTITFTAPGALTLPASAFNLTATSTSGLTVAFASTTTSICTVTGVTLTPLTAGTCTITASQAGNTNYLAATSVTQSFTINPAVVSSGGGGGGGGGAGGGGGSPLTIDSTTVTISTAVNGPPGSQSVTLSYVTQTQGAPTFSSNFNTNQGQGWISVSPATGAMTQASFAGFLYTYTATVSINADPTGIPAGSAYTGTVNFSSGGGVVSVAVTMNVSAQPAKFTVTPQSLTFSYQQGDATLPATQGIAVFSTPTGATFTATASSTGNWLSVDAGGKTPGAVAVSVDVTKLSPGTASGKVTISSGASFTVDIPVSITIAKANPPVLSVSLTMEDFSVVQGGAAVNGQVTVSNSGGGTLRFTALSDQSWLNVAGSGSATPGSPASLAFTSDPSNLLPGIYTGHITVSDANSSAQSVVTVVLTVTKAAAPTIQLSKNGVTLTAVSGGAAPQSQTVTVTNSGAGTLNWTTQVSTTSGGTWLTATGSGTSLSISAGITGLAAGSYYGSVNVVAANATNSPQAVSVVLNVLAPTASPGVSVSTGGVLLIGTAGASAPVSQAVGLFNASSAAIGYSATALSGSSWLSVNPSGGSANPGANTIQIAADMSALSAGVQSGTVTLAFADGSTASIEVVALVLNKATGSARLGLQAVASPTACPSGKASFLIPIFRQPANQSSVQVAAAATVQAQVADDCGNAVTNGSVQVTFGNGDPAINLNSVGSGIWEATWVPQNAAPSATLQIVASQNGLTGSSSLSALSTVTVTVLAASANAAPQPTGIANAASAGQATPQVVAPGSYIAIYGTGLAGTGNPSATTLPLPTTLNGTQLFLGGLPMPLLYAGAGQVNALVPEGIAPNATYPLLVVRGATQSVPVALTVTELQPGAYTVNTSGSGAGIVTNALTGALITTSNPAHAEDYLVIYGTGLGTLTGPNGETQPTDGAAAPGTIVYHTTATVTAEIGGVTTPVLFSGLTPTFAGLYQVNVQVPPGITPGTAVSIILTATDPVTGATAQSNPVTIAIQ